MIEQEYLALLINKPELIGLSQIKAKFLETKENQEMFKAITESYQKYKLISIPKILEKHKDFDINYYTELLTEVLVTTSDWKRQMKLAEETILQKYKERYTDSLWQKYKTGKVDFTQLTKILKNVSEYKLSYELKPLDRKEIEKEIADKNRIVFPKFKKLSEILKLTYGDFVLVGTTTGNGKSGLLLNLLNELMDNYQCIYFNMEMSKSTVYKRIVSIASEVPMNYLNSPTEHQKELIEKAYDRIEKNEIIIDHTSNKIEEIKQTLLKYKNINKHTVLFLDHIGLTRTDKRLSLYENATEVAKELRQMCLEYDCTIISASQLNRSAYKEDIDLSMLKDSGELENSASKVLLLHRQQSDEIVTDIDLEVAKNRDGLTGKILMQYDKGKQIFNERMVS